MANPIWPSVSGAMARSQAIDTVANNMANVNTDGFKKDVTTFKAYLKQAERSEFPNDIPKGPITDSDFYPLDGRHKAWVTVDGTHALMKQGALKPTHRPLDIAIDGPGFFEVGTPEGVRYTRHGSFRVAKDGMLVTTEGYPVLTSQPGGLATALPATAVQSGQGGQTTQGGVATDQGISPDLLARTIKLTDVLENPSGPLTVTEQGNIYSGADLIAKLSVVEFKKPAALAKRGQNLFEDTLAQNRIPEQPRTLLRQGMIETSNVNPVEEMAEMIRQQRLFEHDLKAIQTFDQMMDKEVNDLGKL